MHSVIWIWHFPIQVFILITNTVMIVHVHIIENWEGVWHEHSSI
jgi:hypothetical protein